VAKGNVPAAPDAAGAFHQVGEIGPVSGRRRRRLGAGLTGRFRPAVDQYVGLAGSIWLTQASTPPPR